MIRVLFILCSLVAAAGADFSGSEDPASRYQKLWEVSPFTSSREVEPVQQKRFDKLALGGVSKMEDGYFVVLIDKQDSMKRIVLGPGEESDFKVLRVDWSNQNWKKTAVVISDGESSGSIEFDSSSFQQTKNPVAGEAARPRSVRAPK